MCRPARTNRGRSSRWWIQEVSAAEVTFDERVVGAYDKGDKGALILIEREVREKQSGDKLCTLGMTIFARGDGNFGGPAFFSDALKLMR